jgi:hypothetical protein
MSLITKNFTDKSLWNPGFKINNVNVATVGQVNSMLQAAGVVVGMGGQDDVGKRLCIADIDGPDWSLASIGTLFGGIYQLVLVDSGATAANIFTGAAAYFLDTQTGGGANSGSNNYVVTDSAHAVSPGDVCGVFLNPITPGQWGFIQISGKATVKYTAAVTSASQSASTVSGGATAGTFDNIIAAITGITLPTVVGTPIAVPANGALGTVFLRYLLGRY